MKKMIYAVKRGKKTGIFDDWEKCEPQIERFSGALYRGFAYRTEFEKEDENKEGSLQYAFTLADKYMSEPGIGGFRLVYQGVEKDYTEEDSWKKEGFLPFGEETIDDTGEESPYISVRQVDKSMFTYKLPFRFSNPCTEQMKQQLIEIKDWVGGANSALRKYDRDKGVKKIPQLQSVWIEVNNNESGSVMMESKDILNNNEKRVLGRHYAKIFKRTAPITWKVYIPKELTTIHIENYSCRLVSVPELVDDHLKPEDLKVGREVFFRYCTKSGGIGTCTGTIETIAEDGRHVNIAVPDNLIRRYRSQAEGAQTAIEMRQNVPIENLYATETDTYNANDHLKPEDLKVGREVIFLCRRASGEMVPVTGTVETVAEDGRHVNIAVPDIFIRRYRGQAEEAQPAVIAMRQNVPVEDLYATKTDIYKANRLIRMQRRGRTSSQKE